MKQAHIYNKEGKRIGPEIFFGTTQELAEKLKRVTLNDGDVIKIEEAERIRSTPYERARAAVYATGNKWAIENFNATHN